MNVSPFCLGCERKIDPDRAVLVLVDRASRRDRREREGSWVCTRPTCLRWLVEAAEEEKCELLEPRGIFAHPERPSWVVWMSKDRARAEAEASDLFGAMYRPFTTTAR